MCTRAHRSCSCVNVVSGARQTDVTRYGGLCPARTLDRDRRGWNPAPRASWCSRTKGRVAFYRRLTSISYSHTKHRKNQCAASSATPTMKAWTKPHEQHLANGGAALTPDRRSAFVLGTVGRRLVALRHGSPQSGPPCVFRKAGRTIRDTRPSRSRTSDPNGRTQSIGTRRHTLPVSRKVADPSEGAGPRHPARHLPHEVGRGLVTSC